MLRALISLFSYKYTKEAADILDGLDFTSYRFFRMAYSTTVLGQLLQLLPRTQFQACTRQHSGDKHVKHFSCWNQLTVLLFAQLAEKESLREIETAMRVQDSTLYHLGIKNVSRDTLAKANQNRSYHIFEKTFHALLEQCRLFSPGVKELDIPHELYALDATVVSVCFQLMPWAKYRKKKGAFKIHRRPSPTATDIAGLLKCSSNGSSNISSSKPFWGRQRMPCRFRCGSR